MDPDLKRLYKLAAGGSSKDFIVLLEAVCNEICDIRKRPGGAQYPVDVREASAAILTSVIDNLSRIRKALTQRPVESDRDGLD